MNEILNVIAVAHAAIQESPELKASIVDAMEWTIMEIEEGESASHELELFEGHIQELKADRARN